MELLPALRRMGEAYNAGEVKPGGENVAPGSILLEVAGRFQALSSFVFTPEDRTLFIRSDTFVTCLSSNPTVMTPCRSGSLT